MLSQFVVVPTQHTRSHYDIMDTTLRRLKNVRRESTHDRLSNKIHIPYYDTIPQTLAWAETKRQ